MTMRVNQQTFVIYRRYKYIAIFLLFLVSLLLYPLLRPHLLYLYKFVFPTVVKTVPLNTIVDGIFVSEASKRLPLPPDAKTFIFVMTYSDQHEDRVPAINATWLHRVEHAEFFTSKPIDVPGIPYRTVFMGLSDDYLQLFHKTRRAFEYSYKYISKEFDWYIKSDDDTYILAENLNKFLRKFDPNEPIYAGLRFKLFVEKGYNSGGMYILSRKAVQILVEDIFPNTTACPFYDYEDVQIARCLATKGIYPIPTRDVNNQGLFHMFRVEDLYKGYNSSSIRFEEFYSDRLAKGFNEFSADSIAFHKMEVNDFYLADIMAYRIKTM